MQTGSILAIIYFEKLNSSMLHVQKVAKARSTESFSQIMV